MRVTACLALVALPWLAACGSQDSEADSASGPGRRAVVIGIDGADWKLIDALAAEGRLPNLSRLREAGVWGEIATLNDIALSPVIWTSVATGKSAAKHGIAWFMVDQPDGTRVPVRSSNRTTDAIWNILAENGLRSNVVGWWASYPAEEVPGSVIVSDALGFHGFGATARGGNDVKKTYPSELFAEMDARVPPEQQVSHEFVSRFVHIDPEVYREEMFDPAKLARRNPFNPIHLFQEYAVTAQGYAAIAEGLLARDAYDLFMVYFEQVDSFSHLFMKHAPPQLEWVGDEEFERYRDVVREWYVYQDELLGRVLAKIDLETTAVFVLSDHGFKSGERRIRSEEVVDVRKAHLDHETHGIFIAAGPGIRKGAEVVGASVLDMTPTALHYLGLAVGKDMDGKVLLDVFDDAFRAENPIEYVSTHDRERGPGGKAPASGGADDFDAADLAAIEGGLAALGYTGDEDGGHEGGAPGDESSVGTVSSPELHNNMGRVHLQQGDVDAAEKEFQAALELDPNNADALLNVGAIQQAKGNVSLARHTVQRALQADPNSIGALSQLAEISRDQGQLDEAIRLFEEAMRIDDSQPFLLMGFGDVLQRAGRFAEAERAFLSVLELEPDSFKARYNLGVTYTNMGRVEDAIARYEEALELEPKHPEAVLAHNNLGAIFLGQGKTDEALARFERATEASPFHLESRYNVAIIYLERGRVKEAVTLLEEAAALQPNHEQVNLQLGFAHAAQGDSETAFRSFVLVRRLYPANWAASVGLALVNAQVGQADEARVHLAEALALGGDAARAAAGDFAPLAPFLGE